MSILTIQEVRDLLDAKYVPFEATATDFSNECRADDTKTVFMRQGRGGKVIHLSAGSCRQNNLYCGATYSFGGSRRSYLFPLPIQEADTDQMCKNCLARLTTKSN